jgi:adenylyltransferase/sulfurtransferase
MNAKDFLSRERAAGYDPNRLAAARVLLIGAGALGQNVGLNLALSQVGQLLVVDFDDFEPHNATRSPLFPSPYERRRWGTKKAAVVAKKLRKLVAWSKSPRLSYYVGPIQQFGDSPFQDASIVVSAVDSNRARAYIGEMCRKHRTPLVEGGFDGADISYSVLANEATGPCWLCNQAIEIVDQLRISCAARAAEAEAAGFVPATQPAAAALGAFMAEAVIQVAHKNREVLDRRVYLNTRTTRATTVRLPKDEHCQGRHAWPKSSFELALGSESRAGQLLDQLSRRLQDPVVVLPDRFVAAAPCMECAHAVEINKPTWALSGTRLCIDCGGPWKRRNGAGDGSLPLEVYTTLSKDTPKLLDLPLSVIGIAPGSVLEVQDHRDASMMFCVYGSLFPTPI